MTGHSISKFRFACILIVIAVGCDQPAQKPSTAPTTVKVASLVPAATDLIVGMGAGDHLVAVSNWDAKRPEIDALPRVGDYRTVDWEKLAEIKPNVMIVQFSAGKMPSGLQDKADSMGIRLVNVKLNRLDDIFTTIDSLGDAIGEGAKAQVANQKLHAELDAVRKRVEGKTPVRTLLIRSDSDLASVGGGNFMDDLLTIAGGKNVLQGGENSYPTIDQEQLLSLNPDAVVLLFPGESQQVVDKAKQFWAGMTDIPAVRTHRIYILTDSYLLLPGMSAGKIAGQLADLLHPESTSGPTGTAQGRLP
jgi:iron complex transport system substrate-binding protein